MNDSIEERKADHIEICLEEDVQAQKTTTGFEDVSLVHKALPEIERKIKIIVPYTCTYLNYLTGS